MFRLKNKRGDTLVEALIGFGVFSLLAVGVVGIMNRGVAMAQQGLERTLVRQQIDTQVELLRYARDTGSPVWSQIKAAATVDAPEYNDEQCVSVDPANIVNRFIVDSDGQNVAVRKGASVMNKPEYIARVDYESIPAKSYGLWVEAVRVDATSSSQAKLRAYDMHIRGCWYAPGDSRPQMVATIVRLYE